MGALADQGTHVNTTRSAISARRVPPRPTYDSDPYTDQPPAHPPPWRSFYPNVTGYERLASLVPDLSLGCYSQHK